MKKMKGFEGDGYVFVMDADGGNLNQLTDDSRADNGVCWSPCGKYLMYTSAPKSNHQTERLKVIDAQSGEKISFHYDRSALEQEIGSLQMLNSSIFQMLVPDFIERGFVDASFWGEERRPHWTR
jgi:Tol biopolymer transport system component